MNLMSRAADYATRAMVHVASAEKGDTPTTQEIAERQGISQVFLQKIVQRLARAGLLRRRGKLDQFFRFIFQIRIKLILNGIKLIRSRTAFTW